MPRVIVLDPLSKEGLDLLESAGSIEVVVKDRPKGQGLARRAARTSNGASAAAA